MTEDTSSNLLRMWVRIVFTPTRIAWDAYSFDSTTQPTE